MKLLKRIAFCLLGILLFVLTIATILEKVNGTEFVNNHIYSSVPFIILWGSTALASLLYMIKRKLHRQWTTFLLHLSFILILVGAFVTWIDGEQGTLQLKLGEKTMSFINKGGEKRTLPFSISLEDFEIIYYKGTRAPMDYVSRITVSAENNSESLEGEISMNKIFSFMNYRFYQSGYDANGQGTVLSVSHDPYGIGITYTGYSILLVSIILFFLNPQSTFRQLMKSYRNNSQDIKKGCSILFLLVLISFITTPTRAYEAYSISSLNLTEEQEAAEAAAAEPEVYELCEIAADKAEKEYNIKTNLLQTIASVESGRWNAKAGRRVAWPWTVHANGKGRYYKTKAEAVVYKLRLFMFIVLINYLFNLSSI